MRRPRGRREKEGGDQNFNPVFTQVFFLCVKDRANCFLFLFFFHLHVPRASERTLGGKYGFLDGKVTLAPGLEFVTLILLLY